MNAYIYSAICAGVLIPLELIFPAKRQRRLRKGVVCDLLHLSLTAAIIPVALGFTAAGVMKLSQYIPTEIPASVNSLPIWGQVLMLFVIAETMFYLAHRLVHAIPLLWRFHAIHHSSDELDFLSAVRGHPVDAVIHWSLVIAPLILLELNPAIFAAYTVVFYFHSYIVHANVRLRIPYLQNIIVTPDFHHCHHDRSPRHNYAGMFALLDLVFRSNLRNPEEHPRCGSLGISSNYFVQLLHPFVFWKKRGSKMAVVEPEEHAGCPPTREANDSISRGALQSEVGCGESVGVPQAE